MKPAYILPQLVLKHVVSKISSSRSLCKGQALYPAKKCVKEHSYLGVILDQTTSFSPHVNNIVSKASKILNFVKRNLYKCSPLIKATAYISLVRPILEYASSAWDPHLLKDIYSIDQIQRRAARWVLQNYNRYSSVTSMQQQLHYNNIDRGLD